MQHFYLAILHQTRDNGTAKKRQITPPLRSWKHQGQYPRHDRSSHDPIAYRRRAKAVDRVQGRQSQFRNASDCAQCRSHRRRVRIRLPDRPLGLWQDDAAAYGGRIVVAQRGTSAVQRAAGERARKRNLLYVPGLQQGFAALAHRRRQYLAGAGSQQRARRAAWPAHQGTARQGRPRQSCRSLSGAAFRRHAAACANRTLPRARAVSIVDGRAVRRTRCHDAPSIAG